MAKHVLHPVIKWTGSKRYQSEEIIQYFPDYINTYYEPFCGSCSVIFQLLTSSRIRNMYMNRVVCSDINGDLIDLLKTIKNDPKVLCNEYERVWSDMSNIHDVQDRRKYYEDIREEFNQTRSPYLYFFLLRTCTNGLPRYNRYGNFNQTLHLTRMGMKPERVRKIVDIWGDVFKRNHVQFRRCDYKEIMKDVDDGDFLYLDPPYELTRSNGRYFGRFDYEDMFCHLRNLNDNDIKYVLSFTKNNNGIYVPIDCYENEYNIKSSVGGFRTTVLNMSNEDMYECLYVN